MVAALADLFATFEAEEQQLSSHSVVAPTRLREALDALNSQRFQIGAPSDTIYRPVLASICPILRTMGDATDVRKAHMLHSRAGHP